jgi:enediyne biosynthesis protein E4
MNPTLRTFFVAAAAAVMASGALKPATAQEPEFTAITDTAISDDYAFSFAWGDYDGDGLIDLLAVDFYSLTPGLGRIYVFRNRGDGAFERTIIEPSEYSHTGFINSATWGDFDNNGRPDILISGGGLWIGPNPNILLRQQSDGTFVRSSTPSFPSGNSQSALWGDFNHDGWLDIFSGYWTGTTTAVTDSLFLNQGDGTFASTQPPGIHQLNDNSNSAMAATTGDFDGDGTLDILVTTIDPNRSRIYFNRGDGTFDRRLIAPSAFNGYGNGIAVADYDNDGDLDFIMVSKSGSGSWTCACDGDLSGETLVWRNNGVGEFEPVVAGDLGNGETIGANGAAWADYNNDGWLDVILFRCIYSNGRGQDPANVLYRNNGDGTFTRVLSGALVEETGDARAGAWGDFDNDGFMDLAVANYNWFAAAGSNLRPVLYRNEGNGNHWLKLRLVGTQGNRDAVGAKVRLKATIDGQELWQLRQVQSNGSWLASQNDPRPHFGLGDATTAEVVRIEWPSGEVTELYDVAADQILDVQEPPRLQIESAIALSWPAHAGLHVLYAAEAVDGPWTEVNVEVRNETGRFTAWVKAIERSRYYRLGTP